MNTIERFTDRAELYSKYRPSYPKEIIGFLRQKIGLNQEHVLAEIGSGTGIFSRLLLENGNLVYCVEPNAAMRRIAEQNLRVFPNFRSVNATAEQTGLANRSIDMIFAAQSFHWFDKEKTRIEFSRILKEQGFVVIIFNLRLREANDFLRAYEEVLQRNSRDYEQVHQEMYDTQKVKDFLSRDFGFETFENHQELDLEGLIGRTLSVSCVNSDTQESRQRVENELKRLFDEFQENGKIKILYETKVFYGRI